MNEVIKYTGQLGKTILNFFPADPVENVIVQFSAMFDNAVLEYLNYFIPVGPFLKILAIWLVAVAAYYVVTPLARWAKLIS